MLHEDMVSLARQLALIDGSGKPRQASLRRSVSTAYYALFHALCDACVKETVQWKRRTRFWAVVSPIYRAIDHGSAKRLFSQFRTNASSAEPLRQLATYFLGLQEIRLRADYDPALRLFRAEALRYADDADKAITLLGELDADTRTELTVRLLTKAR